MKKLVEELTGKLIPVEWELAKVHGEALFEQCKQYGNYCTLRELISTMAGGVLTWRAM